MSGIARTAIGATVAVALAVAAVAGFGSSSSGSGAGSPRAHVASASDTSRAAAKGAPLKILTSTYVNSPAGSTPEIFAAAQVAADNINKAGGIKGHPIEVVTCNGKVDPDAELACARKGISDHVIASDSNVFFANAPGALGALKAAGIADVASASAGASTYTLSNTNAIDFATGEAAVCLSTAARRQAGGGKIAAIVGENPYAAGLDTVFDQTIAANPSIKKDYAGTVMVPSTTTDFSSYIQQAASLGAQYIFLDEAPTAVEEVITAAASAGEKWSYCFDTGEVDNAMLTKLAPLAKQLVLVTEVPPLDNAGKYPLVKKFVDQMNTAHAAGVPNSSPSINVENEERAWMGMQVIDRVANSIRGRITAKSFAQAMKKSTVNLGWVDLNFAKPLGMAPYKRVFNPYGFVTRWDQSTKSIKTVAKVGLVALWRGSTS